MDEIPKFKVGQGDLDYDPFQPTFVPLIYYSLQPIASSVREIFTGIRKFKIQVT